MKTLFGELVNYLKIDYVLSPGSGFVIKSGKVTSDPISPDDNFIRVITPYGNTIYVPGSSIKGVFRSYIESILKGMRKTVCGFKIYSQRRNKTIDSDCGGKEALRQMTDVKDKYNEMCYSCRMFGSKAISSIVRFEDLFPWKEEYSEDDKKEKAKEINKYLSTKHGIRIDRKSGSTAPKALYDTEILSGGEFYGSIILKNSEIWMLAMIFKTIDDVNDGFVKFGSMKSRGLGRLNIKIENISGLFPEQKLAFNKFKNKEFMKEYLMVDSTSFNGFIPPYKMEVKNMDVFKKAVFKNVQNIQEW